MKNFSKKIYIYIFLLFFGGFSFVFAQGQNANQIIKPPNENQMILDVVQMVNELHGRQFDFLAWFLGAVGSVLFLFIVYFGWETNRGRRAAIEKSRKEIEEEMKNEFDKKLGKLFEGESEVMKRIIERTKAKLEIKDKKILIISSGERNIKNNGPEIELINDFRNFNQGEDFIEIKIESNEENKRNKEEQEKIEEMKNKIKGKNPDIVIFDADISKVKKDEDRNKNKDGEENKGGGKNSSVCYDIIYRDIVEAIKQIEDKKIPIIVYIKGTFDRKLLNEYFLSNFANTPFTLASSTYTMLKVMSLRDKK